MPQGNQNSSAEPRDSAVHPALQIVRRIHSPPGRRLYLFQSEQSPATTDENGVIRDADFAGCAVAARTTGGLSAPDLQYRTVGRRRSAGRGIECANPALDFLRAPCPIDPCLALFDFCRVCSAILR